MNIEEERKNSTEFILANKETISQMMQLPDGRFAVEFAAFMWLAAKRHADEMANLQVVIKLKGPGSEPSSYPWIVKAVSGPCPSVLEDFRTEEDALEWAINCGHRRVAE